MSLSARWPWFIGLTLSSVYEPSRHPGAGSINVSSDQFHMSLRFVIFETSFMSGLERCERLRLNTGLALLFSDAGHAT